ncbi:MAG: aspartate/glutamate racemase family protein [Candidatus Korarchaeota archaeon]|nr:aspartate/glutamate racemase family protein [Candidatus Korarchaeota archaeon]
MYGWRARLGLIIPSSNTTMEEEFRKLLPKGISLHVARVRLRKVNVRELLEMERYAKEAAQLLGDAGVDLIAYGCTTGSLVGGLGYDLRLAEEIKGTSGIKAITTAGAVLDALRQLSVEKVAVATPYIDEVNEKEKEFLEANGFQVVNIKGLQIEENLEIGRQPPEVAYRLAKDVDRPEAEAVFISCTNFRTIEVIAVLEADLGKPVFSSNTATLWASLKSLRIREKLLGLGSLLESLF